MKIIGTKISNYRNLNGSEIELCEKCNFIVGENNLGKSNYLQLFNIMFNSRGFSKDDFFVQDEPIEVEFRLQLEEAEIGLFDDLCDPSDEKKINLICRQVSADENMEFSHKESLTKIKPGVFRHLNFIYYDSLRNPSHEINFDRARGAGKFLSNLVKISMNTTGVNETEYINDLHINNLVTEINKSISKIKAFKDFDISAQKPSDITGIVTRIIQLQDGSNSSFLDTGYGVQFMALITLTILDKIQQLLDKKGDYKFTVGENKESHISLILGLDEPEIHLHPHAQRSLIKYLNAIINNEDDDFKHILKTLFQIDGLMGQVILVTHSPNIILTDYKKIVRFHRNGSFPTILSGNSLKLDDKSVKHIKMQHLNYKEAFFSRGVFIVEGETEEGCVPLFFKKLGYDCDELGISLIKSNGGAYKTIKIVVNLFEHFKIPAVGIADRDDNTGTTGDPNIFLTDSRDFEFEIIQNLNNERELRFRELIKDLDGERTATQSTSLELHKKKFGYTEVFDKPIFLRELDDHDDRVKKIFYYCWLSTKKTIDKGQMMGEFLEADEIPLIYKEAINRLVALVS